MSRHKPILFMSNKSLKPTSLPASTLKQLIINSPWLLVIGLSLCSISSTIVQYLFLHRYVFKNTGFGENWNLLLSILLPVVFEFGRLSLGLASARDFAKGQTIKSVTGLFLSLIITAFLSHKMYEMTSSLPENGLLNSVMCQWFIASIVFSYVLEVRFALTIKGEYGIDLTTNDTPKTRKGKGK